MTYILYLQTIPNENVMNKIAETYAQQISGSINKCNNYLPTILWSTSPWISMWGHIGIWNTILFVMLIYITSILHQTIEERDTLNDLSRLYVPKWKRKTIYWKMKSVITCKYHNGMKHTENIINNWEVKRPRRRNAVTKHNSPGTNYSKRTRIPSLMTMAAIAMTTQTATISETQRLCTFDTDSKMIGIDNRCSACISCDKNDFAPDLKPCKRSIKGFGGTRHNGTIMTGTIIWNWCDDTGRKYKFTIPRSYYVPEGKTRLLSPQHWAQTQKDKIKWGTGEKTNSTECQLYWNGGKCKRTIPLHKGTNVATFSLAPGYANYDLYCQEAGMTTQIEEEELEVDKEVAMVSDSEDDTPPDQHRTKANDTRHNHEIWRAHNPQRCEFNIDGPNGVRPAKAGVSQPRETMNKTMQDLMKLHQRMGHISFHKLQEMARQGAISKEYAKCDIPVCTSCMYAKMTKRPWRGKQRSNNPPVNKPAPGEVVSVDQMVSSTHGLVAQITGILTTARYKYATVYVDQGSRLGYVYLQKTATAEETLKGKMAFELYARNHGIAIKSYHADNGIFRANAWVQHCMKMNQTLTFAGVNAHHQNGIAERRIRELQELARTMMIHAARRWPKCITANLWPYALRMANDAYNHTPNMGDSEKRSPISAFAKSDVATNPKHFQTFGCPTYVLNNTLQQNAPFNKWRERSKVGIYLGKSPAHSNNVALVLDRRTGLVSPQFHVRFDPSFHSVMQDEFDSQWQNKAGFIKKEPATNTESGNKKRKSQGRTTRNSLGLRGIPKEEHSPEIPLEEGGSTNDDPTPRTHRREGGSGHPEGAQEGVENNFPIEGGREELQHQREGQPPQAYNMRKRPKTVETQRQVNFISQEDNLKSQGGSIGMAKPIGRTNTGSTFHNQPHLIAMVGEIEEITQDENKGEILCLEAMYPEYKSQYDNMRMEVDPLFAYKATADPDTMYMHEAMREKDADKFKEAMTKEVEDQLGNGNFTIIPKSQVPKGKIILPAVWQMRRKRDIRTREIKKYKARLNIDGSRMVKGIHYDQTYAPVASWKFIRLLLIMVAKYGWHSRQLDYVLAFPQAPVEKDIYMKIPKGFTIENKRDGEEYVLKIHRNIYGQKQAGRVWYKYLTNKLTKELGFKQSKVDECIFYRGTTMYVLYTDDSLLAGPNKGEIDQIIKDLKAANLDITDEGDIQDFLGVNIDMKTNGEIHLSQPHLIDQIMKDLKFPCDDKTIVKTKETPAKTSDILKRDTLGEDFDNSFHYRSVIGKLNYLEKGTRSDILYITHQCARFTENPKQSHAKAIRWLGRYLKQTRDKGLIMRPIKNKGLEVYVDADFSGNWDPKEPQNDRDTARSRHGYIIMYEGCPMIWKSQLQSEIALSSTESEYIGISYALREVIPIMELLKEMKRRKFPVFKTKPKVHCKVFEDNSGAVEMARTHKYRPRTKHLNVKLHHFRDYVTRGEISIHKIDTKEQYADYLTKPVTKEILTYLRRKVMGW